MIFKSIIVDAVVELFCKTGPSMAVFFAGADQGDIVLDPPLFIVLRGRSQRIEPSTKYINPLYTSICTA